MAASTEASLEEMQRSLHSRFDFIQVLLVAIAAS